MYKFNLKNSHKNAKTEEIKAFSERHKRNKKEVKLLIQTIGFSDIWTEYKY